MYTIMRKTGFMIIQIQGYSCMCLCSEEDDWIYTSAGVHQLLHVHMSTGVYTYMYYIITSIMLQHCGRAGATQSVAMRRAAEVV